MIVWCQTEARLRKFPRQPPQIPLLAPLCLVCEFSYLLTKSSALLLPTLPTISISLSLQPLDHSWALLGLYNSMADSNMVPTNNTLSGTNTNEIYFDNIFQTGNYADFASILQQEVYSQLTILLKKQLRLP